MEHFQKINRHIIVIIVSTLLSTYIHSNKYLLNSYSNPNRLIFRLSSNVFECSLLGVSVPYYNINNQCVPDIMSNIVIGFFQNNLNLEQLYEINITNGYCVVNYGNINFNEKIIKDGYGVVNRKSINNQEFLDKLLYLENKAIENKLGLWNHFIDEMECFQNTYK